MVQHHKTNLRVFFLHTTLSHQLYQWRNNYTLIVFIWLKLLKMQYTHLTKALIIRKKITKKQQSNPLAIRFQIHILTFNKKSAPHVIMIRGGVYMSCFLELRWTKKSLSMSIQCDRFFRMYPQKQAGCNGMKTGWFSVYSPSTREPWMNTGSMLLILKQ